MPNDTQTQDELRQLHEAGARFIERVKVRFSPAPEEYRYRWRDNQLTQTGYLVGWATQLLDELYPDQSRNIFRYGVGQCRYGDYCFNSLTALCLDLAQRVKEKRGATVRKCKRCGIELPDELDTYCGPRCTEYAKYERELEPAQKLEAAHNPDGIPPDRAEKTLSPKYPQTLDEFSDMVGRIAEGLALKAEVEKLRGGR